MGWGVFGSLTQKKGGESSFLRPYIKKSVIQVVGNSTLFSRRNWRIAPLGVISPYCLAAVNSPSSLLALRMFYTSDLEQNNESVAVIPLYLNVYIIIILENDIYVYYLYTFIN